MSIVCPECGTRNVTNARAGRGDGDVRRRLQPDGNSYPVWVSHWICSECGNRFEVTQRVSVPVADRIQK